MKREAIAIAIVTREEKVISIATMEYIIEEIEDEYD